MSLNNLTPLSKGNLVYQLSLVEMEVNAEKPPLKSSGFGWYYVLCYDVEKFPTTESPLEVHTTSIGKKSSLLCVKSAMYGTLAYMAEKRVRARFWSLYSASIPSEYRYRCIDWVCL
jgi:hypothetical protein